MHLDELIRLIRGPSRPTRRQLRYRRRRAGALAVVAFVALVAGMIAGKSGDGVTATAEATEVGWYGHLTMLAGAGRGSLDLEQRAAEDGAITRALAKTPFVRKGGTARREIALTFDDGPSAYTEPLLDILARERVPATFFINGKNVPDYPDAMQRLVDSGMPIGNHTQSHANLEQLSPADQQAQIDDGARAIEQIGAPFPRLFRPPYGAYDRTTHDILGQERVLSVLWSVDSQDYQRAGTDSIAQKVVSGAHPGAIVLMHDGGGPREQTLEAVARIIPELRRMGYRFVTVPRLLLDNPPEYDEQGLPPGFNSAGAG